MNTLTENELIAEFMGFPVEHEVVAFTGGFKTEKRKLSYDTSWDWLMPVVEKIEKVRGADDVRFSVEIHNRGCRIYRTWFTVDKPHFKWHQTGGKLNSTYGAVVEFIKWYNENKGEQRVNKE